LWSKAGPVNATLERALDRALARSPAQAVMRRRARKHLAVLAYHGVDDAERFALHLDWLAREAHPVSIDEAVAAAAGGAPLPDNAVLITFDDGHRSVFDVAMPLLSARGMPAVVYVVAGMLDTNQPFWWDEVTALSLAGGTVRWWEGRPGRDLVRALKTRPDRVRVEAIAELRETASTAPPVAANLHREELPVLEANGVAVGNHSLTHPCLPRCDATKIEHEVRTAQDILTDALGHPPRTFAYPDGQWDATVAAAVRNTECELAFLFDHRLATVPASDPFAVSRLRMNAHNTADRFEIIVSGLHSALQRGARRK
jgi:peptidoglycan/xylan/chitin deacetylase (PgdA/CDA1 family)